MPPRVVFFTGVALPTFPATATIEVELAPAETFGEVDLTGKLSLVPWGHKVQMHQKFAHAMDHLPRRLDSPAQSEKR